MLIKVNSLVLYKNKGAIVTDVAQDKYQIRTASGDRKSVRLKDIEFLHSGPCSAIPAVLAKPSIESQMEIAELIQGENMSFDEFTTLIFNTNSPASALTALELLNENCCFSGTPAGGVSANSPEHIQEMLNKEAQKNALKQARADLLERIRSGSVLPEDRTALREIENVAYGESSSSKLMQDLNMEALPEKAQNLLLKLGVWNYFENNPWPRRFELNIAPEYPAFPENLPTEDRLNLTELAAYAIDDADSNDPDDAISFDVANDLLWVHIADPAAAAVIGSEIEEFACQCGSTLYLPEKIIPMLPDAALPVFGLGLQETSPALSFALKISKSGDVDLEKITLSTVKVTRLNYNTAESLMHDPAFVPCVEALQRFKEMRINNNAVMIRLPEVKVRVDIAGQDITIKPLDQSPARELVANAMLATGHAVAKFAAANDIPMPFAVQEEPEMTERPETLPGMYALRKSCRVSTLSTLPGRHAGLGLEPYCRVTSPLRRYEDLLGHIQLRKYLKHEPLLSIAEMDEKLATAEPAAVLRGKLERQCREYWTLVLLAQTDGNWRGEAVYVAKPDERSVWLLPELAYEFKNRYNARLPLGESVNVECIASDPALLSAQFRVIKNSGEPTADDSAEFAG